MSRPKTDQLIHKTYPAMKIVTAKDLLQQDFPGITVDKPYDGVMGRPFWGAGYFVWGDKGAGKSTLATGMLLTLAYHTNEKALYCSSEEGPRVTAQSRFERLGKGKYASLLKEKVLVSDFTTLAELQRFIVKNDIRLVVIDSATHLDKAGKQAQEFFKWAKPLNLITIFIAHATKGGTYRGDSFLAFDTDVEIKVSKATDEDGRVVRVAINEKNRMAGAEESKEIKVPMTYDAIEHRPLGRPTRWRKATPDHEEPEKPRLGGRRLKGNMGDSVRNNPVEVPFSTTLGDIYDTHAGARMAVGHLNRYLNFDYCSAVVSGTYTPISFRARRLAVNSKRKKPAYVVEMLLDRTVHDSACEPNQRAAIKKLVDQHRDLKITISDQKHARKVLKASSYRAREREEAKEKPCKKKAQRSTKRKSSRTKRSTQQKKRSQKGVLKQAGSVAAKSAGRAVDADEVNRIIDRLEGLL